MTMTTITSVVIDLVIVLAFIAVAVLAFDHRSRPGVIPFVLFSILLAIMTVGTAAGRSSILPESWTPYTVFAPFVFTSLAWLALAFEYTGRGPVVTRRRAAGLTVFGFAVVLITALSSVVPDSVLPVWTILINLFQVALVAGIGYGAFLVARSAVSYGDLPRSGSLVLTTAGGALVAITVAQALAPAIPYETAFDLIRGTLAGIALLLLITQVRYRVFETGPSAGHLARETVLDEMPAAVAITGRQGHLLDFNQTAERTFDIAQPDALGEPIEAALRFDADRGTDQPVTIETGEGPRQFEVDRSELTSRGGESIGRAYVLRDVTERRTHQQRLDVLNRVLRHNLRNDLDAIRGFAEALEQNDSQLDHAELGARIQTTARDLADLGATISSTERLLEADRLDTKSVDIDALVDEVVEPVREAYPDASITVSTPGRSTTLSTERTVLGTVLEETLENAVEHNNSEEPHVELVIESREPGVVVEIRDDGPGIPERERSVLLEGEETPLRHGTGLGLWLVYWGVLRLGADLEFRENEPRGSIVSIRLPQR